MSPTTRTLQEVGLLREATAVLSKELRMDNALACLLDTLFKYVRYDAAQILLFEDDQRLFLARESLRNRCVAAYPETVRISDHLYLQRVFDSPSGLLVSDTETSEVNMSHAGRSFLAVPLLLANQNLGILSLVHSSAGRFTKEDQRITQSIGPTIAVAIQNARLREGLEIFSTQLRTGKLDPHE